MFKLFSKKENKQNSVEDRTAEMYRESVGTLNLWLELTLDMIEKQYRRLQDAMPALCFQINEKLEADPQLKARIMANLQLDGSGMFDCLELSQLREEIDHADDDALVVLRNEHASIVGRVKLAHDVDLKRLAANPTGDIGTLTPYYDLDFVKTYLKI